MDRKDLDTRALIITLLVVGFAFTITTIVFATEYSLVNAEMSNISAKLELKIENQVGDGSLIAYLVSVILWTALLGGVIGWVWGRVLFPSLDKIEKFTAGLVLGVFIMPLSFVIPAFLVSARKMMTDYFGLSLPDYYMNTVVKLVGLFSSNQEQGYELFNVTVFIIIGLIVLIFVTKKRKKAMALV